MPREEGSEGAVFSSALHDGDSCIEATPAVDEEEGHGNSCVNSRRKNDGDTKFPAIEKEEKKISPKKKGDEKKSSPVRERNGVLPHFMMATTASMAKQ